MCLNKIEDFLQDMGTSLTEMDLLPNPEAIHHIPKVIARELYDTDIQQNMFKDHLKLMNEG